MIPRVYCQLDLLPEQMIDLSPSASHHIATVLRKRLNDEVILFNGSNAEYQAVIKKITKKIVTVYLHSSIAAQRESPLTIELGQGVSRGDRMDYAIQKAVELGVDIITPVLTERCQIKFNPQRLQNRLNHWQAIIVSASEQSGRLRLPQLNSPLSLADWLGVKKSGLCLVCDPKAGVLSQQASVQQVTLLVGPEGGLTDEEIEQAVNADFSGLRLGPRTLRTETAAVVALTKLQTQWGDL